MGIPEMLLRKTVEAKAKLLRSAKKQKVYFIATAKKEQHALKKIKLTDIDSVFLTLILGLLIATVSFIVEVILFFLPINKWAFLHKIKKTFNISKWFAYSLGFWIKIQVLFLFVE